MYKKRNDGRKFGDLRKMEAKTGIIKRANGSAMFKIGNTHAIAAVYGPRELHPKFLQDPERGVLRCTYNMMSFSGKERIRPAPSRRSKEISMISERALTPVIDLKPYPNAVIDVFIEMTQTDAGTRCAGICAAALALADAGIPMKDMVAAVSVGFIDGQVAVDINGHEDCDMGAVDIPVALLPGSGKLSLLQLDGEISKDELMKSLEAAKDACLKIAEVQKKALTERYTK